MAFADYAAYKAALESSSAFQGVLPKIANSAIAAGAARVMDGFTGTVPAGTTPTTAAVPSRTITGAFGQQNGSSGRLVVCGGDVAISATASTTAGMVIIADRLSHQGGLSGTVTTAQTTNLPTAALTRYTSGEGVMAALTIYTQIGTTATTVTASYTNQSGTAGQITAAVQLGGSGYREVQRMILLPLAAGDTGVRSVESVTVLATTGTAGNFGVTLFKPIAAFPFSTNAQSVQSYVGGGLLGGLEEIIDDACLFPMLISAVTSVSGTIIPIFAEC